MSAVDRDVDAALDGAVAEAQGQIARTDSKASILLAFTGAVGAGVGVGGSAVELPMPAVVVGAAGLLVLLAATAVLLAVVRPRLKPRAEGTLPHWATLTPDQLRAELGIDRRPQATVTLSQIAVTKHEKVQRAVDLLRGAGVLLALAAGIGGLW